MKKKLTLIVLSLFGLLGIVKAQGDVIVDEVLFFSTPSALDISVLKKEFAITYNNNILSDYKKVMTYKTKFQQALNLGVYTVDLVYASSFGKTDKVSEYLSSIKVLTDSLGMKPLIDFEQIKGLNKEGNELDSLIKYIDIDLQKVNVYKEDSSCIRHFYDTLRVESLITLDSIGIKELKQFKELNQTANSLSNLINQILEESRKVGNSLNKKSREDTGLLYLIGVWVEEVYLMALLSEQSESIPLNRKLVESLVPVGHFLVYSDLYNSKPYLGLHDDLVKLDKAFSEVEFIYHISRPCMVETEDGVMMITGCDKGYFDVKDFHVKEITTQITNIRNKIINNQYK